MSAPELPPTPPSPTYAPPGLTYAAVDQHDLWLLKFADPDCGDQWFGGDGYDEGEARALGIEAWNRYAPAWSVRLMRTVSLDEVRSPLPIDEASYRAGFKAGVAGCQDGPICSDADVPQAEDWAWAAYEREGQA